VSQMRSSNSDFMERTESLLHNQPREHSAVALDPGDGGLLTRRELPEVLGLLEQQKIDSGASRGDERVLLALPGPFGRSSARKTS